LSFSEIKEDFLKFHREFKDDDEQFNYLSLYHFSENVGHKLKGNSEFERFLQRFH